MPHAARTGMELAGGPSLSGRSCGDMLCLSAESRTQEGKDRDLVSLSQGNRSNCPHEKNSL